MYVSIDTRYASKLSRTVFRYSKYLNRKKIYSRVAKGNRARNVRLFSQKRSLFESVYSAYCDEILTVRKDRNFSFCCFIVVTILIPTELANISSFSKSTDVTSGTVIFTAAHLHLSYYPKLIPFTFLVSFFQRVSRSKLFGGKVATSKRICIKRALVSSPSKCIFVTILRDGKHTLDGYYKRVQESCFRPRLRNGGDLSTLEISNTRFARNILEIIPQKVKFFVDDK